MRSQEVTHLTEIFWVWTDGFILIREGSIIQQLMILVTGNVDINRPCDLNETGRHTVGNTQSWTVYQSEAHGLTSMSSRVSDVLELLFSVGLFASLRHLMQSILTV